MLALQRFLKILGRIQCSRQFIFGICVFVQLLAPLASHADFLARLRAADDQLKISLAKSLPATRNSTRCATFLAAAASTVVGVSLTIHPGGGITTDAAWYGAMAILTPAMVAGSVVLVYGPAWLIGKSIDWGKIKLSPRIRQQIKQRQRTRLMVMLLEDFQRRGLPGEKTWEQQVKSKLAEENFRELFRLVISESKKVDLEKVEELLIQWNESDDGISKIPEDPIGAFVEYAAERILSGR